MTHEEIRTAIKNTPALKALVPNTTAIAEALSANRTKLGERLITERRIMSALGIEAGEAFLSALEAFGVATLAADHPLKAAQPGLKRVLAWLKTDQGIDVGDPLAQQMLTVLAQLNIVDTASANTVKALARVADPVAEFDVRLAVFADNGTLLV
jgi:hypothetical protein